MVNGLRGRLAVRGFNFSIHMCAQVARDQQVSQTSKKMKKPTFNPKKFKNSLKKYTLKKNPKPQV
jgi:hypothetical protein